MIERGPALGGRHHPPEPAFALRRANRTPEPEPGPATPSSPGVVVSGVSKRYGSRGRERVVLANVSLSLSPERRLAIVGPNGSGKSSLLQIVLGLSEADHGSVALYRGCNPPRIAYVPQDYRNALFPWLTVGANLALNMDGHARDRRWSLTVEGEASRRVTQLTGLLGIEFDLHKYPYQLSGGEQQILVLAQALLREPGLLVADEPLSALDAHRREKAVDQLYLWLGVHRPTLLLVSNDVEEAVFLADAVLVLPPHGRRPSVEVEVRTPHPRSPEWRGSAEYRNLVERLVRGLAE